MFKFKQLLYFFSLVVLYCSNQAELSAQMLRGVTLSTTVTEEDINVLGTWNANVVSYQLAWLGPVNSSDEVAYNEWLLSALDRFDELLPAFKANGIKVILKMQTPPGGFASEFTPAYHRIFEKAWAQDAFVASWQIIAERYKNESQVYGFDICNEPAQRKVERGLLDWNKLALKTARAIRLISKKQKIIVQSIYGDQAKLGKLKKLSVSNVIYNIHMYYPLKFQHQGLYGRPLGVTYPKGSFNAKSLEKNLERVIAYQKKNKVKIYIGEFSAVRWAPNNSAYNYLRDLIAIFEKKKWSWTYHGFREADAWSAEHSDVFGDSTPSPFRTNREALLRIFFAKNR